MSRSDLPFSATQLTHDQKRGFQALARVVAGILGLALLIRLYGLAAANSEDFAVYWRAAQAWVQGVSPYLRAEGDAGFVFKYPPWLLPPLFPLAGVSWEFARTGWFAAEALSLLAIFRWCARRAPVRRAVWWALGCFWWIWAAHFSAGQIVLPIVALALWGGAPGKGALPAAIAAVALGAKVFAEVSFLGKLPELLRTRQWARAAGWVALYLGLAHLVVRWYLPEVSLSELYRDWMAAAGSGGTALRDGVRGAGNHGFPAVLLRMLGVGEAEVGADVLAALGIGAALAWGWARASRGLDPAVRWSGWLALGVVAHPLAWHHSFVAAFPLQALALSWAWASSRRTARAFAVAGIVCTALLIPELWGTRFVAGFEPAGNRSWGVVFSAVAAWLARSARTGAAGIQQESERA